MDLTPPLYLSSLSSFMESLDVAGDWQMCAGDWTTVASSSTFGHRRRRFWWKHPANSNSTLMSVTGGFDVRRLSRLDSDITTAHTY